MTGLNHAVTGALVAAAARRPEIALPVAFASHYILDAIPHFAVEMPDDVFERNRQKHFRAAVAAETLLTTTAIIIFPIILRPRVAWWVTLLTILAAISPDLAIIYRGIKEEMTKKVDPKNFLTKWHIKLSNHHSYFVRGIIFELVYFVVAVLIIILLVGRK